MIKFGIKQSFDKIEQVEERYLDLNTPVGVALPHYWNIYEPVSKAEIKKLADAISKIINK